MIKSKTTGRMLTMALATCLVVGATPIPTAQSILGTAGAVKTVYAAETGDESAAQATKPLETIWKTAEIGTHEGTGSYTYDAAAKTVTVTGSGAKFDKDSGNDDLFYAYFAGKGDMTITAKMAISGEAASGMAGIMVRNAADEATSQSEAIYADLSKKQIRYGRHGGKNGASGLGTLTPESENIYVRLSIQGQKVTYEVASTPDFSDAATKPETLSGIDSKTVGFFATAGVTATFSDITVTSSYTTDDGNAVNKEIFDSEKGEIKFENVTSASYSGKYSEGTSLVTSADGNVLNVVETRPTDKGNIRDDKNFDYLLFPAVSEDMTIQADVNITKIDSGTDKQGFAIGQFDAIAGQAVKCDVLHFQKNKVFQHTFSQASGTGACGNPKTAALADFETTTYSISYSKINGTSIMKVVAADGTVLLDNTAEPFDLTQNYETLADGKAVRYGIALSGVTADISNMTLAKADGTIVYDQNDYYIAVGVAPIISTPKAAVAEDRNSININWDVQEEGSGNIKYSVYVSKDGGEYTKVGDSKINSFSFAAMTGDGNYSFKVVPYGGTTMGTELATEAVSYQAPLAQAAVTAEASSSQVKVSWEAVEGAESYEVYKKLGSNGTAAVAKTTSELTFTDTEVKAEEPYYYYVVAKNSNNSSNPSDTIQVVTTDGHTGKYVYEAEAAKLEVKSKSNDTVFDSKADLRMTSDKAGKAELYVNGAVQAEKTVEAGKEFSFEAALNEGRNSVDVIFTDAEGKATRKAFSFVSNPKYDIVVDSAYTGEAGAAVDGAATYKTVTEAVKSVAADNAEQKVIFIKNGEYEERVEVTSPYITLLGEDSEKTHLFYAVCIANGNADSMWNRNAMYVDTTATGFAAENLTIENSYAYTNGSDQQADALCIVADQTTCVNVRLIGYQDTLLTDSRVKDETGNYAVTRQYFEKCYITGNVDFIYGAGTSVFEDCDIVARYTEYKADGCFTAGRTYASTPYGYVFNNCRFLAEEGVADGAYRMARPWGADDSTTFINCYMGRVVSTETTYGDMSGNSFRNARFAERDSYGPGFVVNNDRPYLSSEQAAAFTIAGIFDNKEYVEKIEALYTNAATPDAPAEPDTPTVPDTPATPDTPAEPDTPADSDSSVGGDIDEGGSITFSDVKIEGNMPAATISSNAVLKRLDGSAAIGAVKLVVDSNLADSYISTINDSLAKSNITFNENVKKLFYDAKMVDADNKELDFVRGSVRLVFAYPENTNADKYDFNVYHINASGAAEKLATTLTPNGIMVEATDLSPFVLTYEAKADTETAKDSGVDTGDKAPVVPFIFASIAAGAAGLYEALRRRTIKR